MKKEENGDQFGEDDIKEKEGVLEAGEDEFGKHNAELMADLRELKQNRHRGQRSAPGPSGRNAASFSAATAISNTFMIGTGETAAAEVPPAEAIRRNGRTWQPSPPTTGDPWRRDRRRGGAGNPRHRGTPPRSSTAGQRGGDAFRRCMQAVEQKAADDFVDTPRPPLSPRPRRLRSAGFAQRRLCAAPALLQLVRVDAAAVR